MRVTINIETDRGDFEIDMTEEEYEDIRFDGVRADKTVPVSALIARAASAATAAYVGAI